MKRSAMNPKTKLPPKDLAAEDSGCGIGANERGSTGQKQPEALDRRQFVKSIGVASLASTSAMIGGSVLPGSANAATPWLVPDRKNSSNEKSPAELITPATRAAIDKGLNYLIRNQVRNGRNRGAFGNGGYSGGVATASLGGLALMAAGHVPGQGTYGKAIDYCVEFVLSNVRDSGYIAKSENSNENMYGHGFSMLFLSQAYGMTQKAEIGEKLRRAVKLTCKTQNNEGGWRYQPRKSDADLSITVCQIMGLRGARDAGIDVPDNVRKKCIDYVKNSQNRNGSFRYTLKASHSTFAMTAAGVTSLYSAGIYEGEQVEKALAYLKKFKPSGGGRSSHYFYSNYYAVQAMWHAGGEYWNDWYPAIRDELIKSQGNDGSWSFSEAEPPFGVAMGCIILQMPLNYVPVFSP